MMPTPVTVDARLARCPRAVDTGFGALDTARGRLPMIGLDVDARVTGLEVALDVRQRFVNATGQAIEATYIFPLPDRAAVQRFRMTVNGRVIDGVLDERGRARDTYDQAIARGQRAAIAEEDRAGVFSLRVGNLMPGEVAVIELGLVGPLELDDGEVTFGFPLVVAPRYIPGVPLGGDQAGLGVHGDTDRTPDASRISPPVLLPGYPNPVRLGFTLSIDGGGLPVSGLRAGLHELHVDAEANGWRIALRPGERLDRDVVLRWRLGGAELRSSAVWAPDEQGERGTVVVTMVPPVGSAAATRPRDVVFVLDRSGSMGGWKMVAARRAVARMIDSLNVRDRFTVLAFDDLSEQPTGFSGLVEASDRRRFEAIEFLAKVEARGGTELAQPLLSATGYLQGGDDRDRILVLITDGQVGNEDDILRQLEPRIGAARVFTLGIDRAVNAAFLRRLAAAGAGAAELVESEDRLDEVMAKIHRRIATPLVTDVVIDAPWLERASQAPARLPSVFAGAPLVARLRCATAPRPGSTIELRGRLPGGTAFVQVVTLDSARPGTRLAASWARARIRDLEDRYAASGGSAPGVEQQIVELSLRHQVLSRFTAFVAVDRSDVANRGAAPHPIVQPVEGPAGWGGAAGGPPPMLRAPSPAAGAVPAMPSAGAYVTRAGVVDPFGPMHSFPPPPARTAGSKLDLDAAEEFAHEESTGARPASPPSPPRSFVQKLLSPLASRSRAPAPVEAVPPPPDANLVRYQARLAKVVTALEEAIAAGPTVDKLQLPIALLIELLEDLRSIGASAFAHALAPIVAELRAALAASNLAEVLGRATPVLRSLATGAPPPPPARKSFWK